MMYELLLGNEVLLFCTEMDAASASTALMRGFRADGAADPHRPGTRVTLEPVSVVIRRCNVKLPTLRKRGWVADVSQPERIEEGSHP